jgi:vacuolar protein sorting-associated protein 13A/C
MFEAQVVFYLNKYLGKYVYGLDPESLKISVWRGDVQLTNLQLKPEALQDLDLPITVKAGLLGRLTLKVGPHACFVTRASGSDAAPGRFHGQSWEENL